MDDQKNNIDNFKKTIQTLKTEVKMLEYISTHDYLTNISNRLFFEKKLSQAIDEAKALNQIMAILYLDLDNFKIINDTMGHSIGDRLLQAVSRILQKNAHPDDIVARVGGDEFAIILHGVRKPAYAEIVAKNILMEFKKPIFLNGKEVYTSASIGIAVYPQCGAHAIEIIKNADIAMYAAKKNGKNQIKVMNKKCGLLIL